MRVLLTGLLLALTACTGPAAAGAPAAPPVVRVMPLGDSITEGYGGTTHAGYRLPLWTRVAGQSGYRVDYVGSQNGGAVPDADHEGHDGWKIGQVSAEADGWLAAVRPTYVLLHIGINDLAWGADPGLAADQLAALIDQVQGRQPGVIVLVMGLIPTSARLEAQVAAFNARARAISRPRLFYVDAPALGPGEMTDELHPNDAGYQRLGDTFYTLLTRVEANRQRAGATP